MKLETLPTTPNTIITNAQHLNELTFQSYLHRFFKIAISMFEWINLPKSCNARWLELCLYNFGTAGFLYDEDFGYINTQAVVARAT